MKNIARAILVLGLASLSVTAFVLTDGETGAGWGLIAVLILFFGD